MIKTSSLMYKKLGVPPSCGYDGSQMTGPLSKEVTLHVWAELSGCGKLFEEPSDGKRMTSRLSWLKQSPPDTIDEADR